MYKIINMKSGIYCIKNLFDNKIYIGSSIDINKRKTQHFSALRNNRHHSNYLQRSFNKYKEENFCFFILEECLNSLLLVREQHFIDILNPRYNICKIAGNSLGTKRNEEARKNISIGQKKRFQKESAWNKGLPKTLEQIESHRLKILGKPSKKKGMTLSKQSCENISKGLIGRKLSDLHKSKLYKKVYEYNENNDLLNTFKSLSETAFLLNSTPGNLLRAMNKNKKFKKRIFSYEQK